MLTWGLMYYSAAGDIAKVIDLHRRWLVGGGSLREKVILLFLFVSVSPKAGKAVGWLNGRRCGSVIHFTGEGRIRW